MRQRRAPRPPWTRATSGSARVSARADRRKGRRRCWLVRVQLVELPCTPRIRLSPHHLPDESLPPKLRFSRKFELNAPRARSLCREQEGCRPMRHVCTAREQAGHYELRAPRVRVLSVGAVAVSRARSRRAAPRLARDRLG